MGKECGSKVRDHAGLVLLSFLSAHRHPESSLITFFFRLSLSPRSSILKMLALPGEGLLSFHLRTSGRHFVWKQRDFKVWFKGNVVYTVSAAKEF